MPLPWHTSQVYRLPDLVPEPLQVPHLTLRDRDSFLRVAQANHEPRLSVCTYVTDTVATSSAAPMARSQAQPGPHLIILDADSLTSRNLGM